MKQLVVATNNRFWLNRLGSNARILSMVQHLRAEGWTVRVAFMGHRYPADVQACQRLGLNVEYSLPALQTAVGENQRRTPAGQSDAPTLRRRLQHARRWLQAACSQHGRPRAASSWLGEIKLRAQARTVAAYADPRHTALLCRLCAETLPHAVLVEYVHLAWLAQAIPPGVLKLIDTHDVQHERQQRFHAAGQAHHLDISAAEEARLLTAFDVVIAIQRQDAIKLRALLPASQIITVMHPQALRAGAAPEAPPLRVGFVGSRMAPNELAARELITRIWPVVQAQAKGAVRLQIIGAVCEALTADALPEGVELLGFVADLDETYDQLAVLANPVRLGGGLKIKNVEALCRAKPLLTTTLGAEGLEDGINSAFAVEDDPAAFAARLAALLNDSTARHALSSQAMSYASAHFDAEKVYAPLRAVLSSAKRNTTSSPADSS